jgi:hypothetical protein
MLMLGSCARSVSPSAPRPAPEAATQSGESITCFTAPELARIEAVIEAGGGYVARAQALSVYQVPPPSAAELRRDRVLWFLAGGLAGVVVAGGVVVGVSYLAR